MSKFVKWLLGKQYQIFRDGHWWGVIHRPTRGIIKSGLAKWEAQNERDKLNDIKRSS